MSLPSFAIPVIFAVNTLSMAPGVVTQKSTTIKSARAMSTSRRNQALTGNPKGLIWNAEIVQTCACVGWPAFPDHSLAAPKRQHIAGLAAPKASLPKACRAEAQRRECVGLPPFTFHKLTI